MPGKDNNVNNNKSSDDSNSVTVKRCGGVGDRNLVSRSGFLTHKTKITFVQLRKAFIKDLILHYFEPDWYIWIETNTFRYAIGGVFSSLTLKTGQ